MGSESLYKSVSRRQQKLRGDSRLGCPAAGQFRTARVSDSTRDSHHCSPASSPHILHETKEPSW